MLDFARYSKAGGATNKLERVTYKSRISVLSHNLALNVETAFLPGDLQSFDESRNSWHLEVIRLLGVSQLELL